jgi:N-glycosylase/DNA lyase
MNAARDFCQGLRIIRQPRWECLATFICSSMKQVAHIRQISRALRERFGEKREVCGYEVFSFPPADRLAGTTENELRKCGSGLSGQESAGNGETRRLARDNLGFLECAA